MKFADHLLPGFLRAAKTVRRLEARVDELKGSLSETKESRDAYKARAHAAEEALRQSRRRLETDPLRCEHFLKQALKSLPPSLVRFQDAFAEVAATIDIEDDMIWSATPDLYFQAGIDGMRIIATACEDHLKREPRSILDLPCGHGRVMRWLRTAYPEASLFGCDTQHHGMAFCENHFGSTSIEPADRPSELASDETVDVIWIGSLFTHLPKGEFVAFLRHLPNLLNDGGIVIFTTHGEEAMSKFTGGADFHLHDVDVAAIEKEYRHGGGFAFAPYKKYPDYGVSFSTPEFIRRHIDETPQFEACSLAEDIWSSLQDVCICRRTA